MPRRSASLRRGVCPAYGAWVIPFAMGEDVARTIPGARLVRVENGHHTDMLVEGGPGTPAAPALLAELVEHLSR